MINVFISHNYKDKPMARKIAGELNKYGIKAWIDEIEIKLGDSLIEKIKYGLEQMDFLIALISEYSVHSEWVKKELDIAMNSEIEGKNVVVIPLLVGKCELPGFLKGKLYADMSTQRKYNENISMLIKRFNISEINDEKNAFTEYNLDTVQIIERLENIQNDNEVIELLESFGRSEGSLFYRDTFIHTVNKLLVDKSISLDVLISLIEACKYCPKEVVLKLKLTQLLDREEDDILQSTINVLGATKSLKIQQKKIFQILRNCGNKDLKKSIWTFFINTKLDADMAENLWEFIGENLLEEKIDNRIIKCLCKLYNELEDEDILKEWYKIWDKSNEKEKINMVMCLCNYGIQFNDIYLMNPKLRDKIKEILLSTCSEDEVDNANLVVTLFICEGDLVESSIEVWDKLMSLDEYSILLTLEMLRDEYNVAYIFNSVNDINALKKFVAYPNKKIKKAALEIIAEINLKESLDILNCEDEFEIKHFSAGSLLYTIIKESNVKEYEKIFMEVRRKILEGYYSKVEMNLVVLGDYIIGNIDLDALISKIDINVEKNIENNYNSMKKIKLLSEKLQYILNNENCDDVQKKQVQELINGLEKNLCR